jgi:hypothetical protein
MHGVSTILVVIDIGKGLCEGGVRLAKPTVVVYYNEFIQVVIRSREDVRIFK